MNRIQKIFQDRTEKVIPFLTAGYPSKKDTVQMVLASEKSGAAMVELGMPFSDPLADGPIIQAASQKAIENGVNIGWILKVVAEIRRESEIRPCSGKPLLKRIYSGKDNNLISSPEIAFISITSA